MGGRGRRRAPGRPGGEGGFTYLLILGVIVIVSIMAQVATTSTATIVRRADEQELLFRGDAYRRAISSYYKAIPDRPEYPRTLEDLLNDPRFAHRRHIRQLYDDPIGGKWRILRNGRGRIVGVASGSDDEPMKKSGFRGEDTLFEGADSYSEWEFTYSPSQESYNVNPVAKPGPIGPVK